MNYFLFKPPSLAKEITVTAVNSSQSKQIYIQWKIQSVIDLMSIQLIPRTFSNNKLKNKLLECWNDYNIKIINYY